MTRTISYKEIDTWIPEKGEMVAIVDWGKGQEALDRWLEWDMKRIREKINRLESTSLK